MALDTTSSKNSDRSAGILGFDGAQSAESRWRAQIAQDEFWADGAQDASAWQGKA
jgi:hypothetical protein